MNARGGRLTVIRALPVQTHVVLTIAPATKERLETVLLVTDMQVSFHCYFSLATSVICLLSSSVPFILFRRSTVPLCSKKCSQTHIKLNTGNHNLRS